MALWKRLYHSRRLAFLLTASALMLASCGHAEYPGAGAAASATATTTPTPVALTWQSASPVPGSEAASLNFAVAPSDGRVTYACGSLPSGATPDVQVWRTLDRGQTWSRGVTLPVRGSVSACQLLVDSASAQRVIAALDTAKMGASPGAADFQAFLSQDGGATWRALPQTGPHGVMSIASYGGAIYVSGFGLSASGADLRDVWVSRDGGATWRALGATSLGPNPVIWINPQTGELLGLNNYDVIPTLWRSENGGAIWTRVSAPDIASAGSQQTYVVAPNGSSWRICAAAGTAGSPQSTNHLACSDDLSKTWTTLTALNPSQQSPKGFSFIAPSDVFAIADDGSLVASYDDITAGMELAMLTPGSSVWTSLGAPENALGTPGAGGTPPDIGNGSVEALIYTTGPGGGMLWANSGNSTHPFITAIYP